MSGGYGAIFWLIIMALLIVVESATVHLLCIWFAVGSLFAMVAASLGAPFWLQLIVFLALSLAALAIGRPILSKKIKPRMVRTGADRVIGQIAVVREEIDNFAQTGRVYANGLDWTARSISGEKIAPGQKAIVKSIDGVKLIVERINEIKEEE